jgi:hypothetical protein
MRRLFLLICVLGHFLGTAEAVNNFAANPWMIDTPGAGNVQSGDITVLCIRWVGASTAGHQAVLQDNNSRTVWEEVAAGANFSTSECSNFFFSGGLKVPTLGSGKLYLYVK